MKFTVKMKTASVVVCAGVALFVRDEAGQDLIEYALVACLVALGAVATMKTLGQKLSSSFLNISSSITSAT